MKKIICLSLSLAFVYADDILGENIQPLKDFSPPSIVKPNQIISYNMENQFDLTDRNGYYFVSDEVDSSMKPFHLKSALYGNSTHNAVLLKLKEPKYYTMVGGFYTKANSYKDGFKNHVDFGYKRLGTAVVAGFTPSEFSDSKLVYIYDDILDDKQPQHSMDPVKTTRNMVAFSQKLGVDNVLNFDVKFITLDRKANNFDLRALPQDPAKAKKVMMKINRNILNTGLSYDFGVGNYHNEIGFLYSKDKHKGKRYVILNDKEILNAYRFGDIKADIFSIYTKNSFNVNENNILNFGLQYQQNKSNIQQYNTKLPNPMSNLNPNLPKFFPSSSDLVKKYHNQTHKQRINKDALSFDFGYEYKSDKSSYKLGFQRLTRIPTNLERFATLHGENGSGFVANPFLNVEKHNRIKFDFVINSDEYSGYLNSLLENTFSVNGGILGDKVDDLVIFDRSSIDRTIITRNVDAKLFSSYLNLEYSFLKHFGSKFGVLYSYGDNATDKRPLYQISPLQITSNLDYKDYFSRGSYSFGGAFRYVFSQNRGDFDKSTGLGIDHKNSSFGVFDLYGGVNFKDSVAISFGVNNVLDKGYYEFISPNHVEAFDYKPIGAMGRYFYAKIHVNF